MEIYSRQVRTGKIYGEVVVYPSGLCFIIRLVNEKKDSYYGMEV